MGGIFFTLMSLGVRWVRHDLGSEAMVFYRSLFQTVALLPWVISAIGPTSGWLAKFRVHLPRGVFGIVSMWCLYIALHHLPMALAYLLTMTSVLWASLLARVFLRERTTSGQLVFSILACLGVALALLGSDPASGWSFRGVGIVAGLLCGMFMGMALTLVRHMRKSMGSVEIVFFFGLTGVVLSAPNLIVRPEWPTGSFEIATVIMVGAAATSAQILMTVGFRYTDTLTASICNMAQTVYSVVLGFVALGEVPPPLFFAGAVLVWAGIVGLLRSGPRRSVHGVDTPV